MKVSFDDVKDLVGAALDIDKAQKTVVSINLLIDETTQPEFQVFVRAGFNSSSVNSRVLVSYFPTQEPDPKVKTDIAVIVAGTNERVGLLTQAFAQEGTPVLVVAEDAARVCATAEESGYPIADDEIIDVGCNLDDETKIEMSDCIGRWIVAHVEDKKLAFSIAYPFVRRPLAYDAITKTAIQNAGVGVVLFVPGADFPVMTINQAKMVLQIAAAYGQPLDKDRIKELLGVLAGAWLFRGVSRKLAGAVPAVGFLIKGGIGYAGTIAIGKTALDYFEHGGNAAGIVGVLGDAATKIASVAEAARGTSAETNAPGARGAFQKAASLASAVVAPVASAPAGAHVAEVSSVQAPVSADSVKQGAAKIALSVLDVVAPVVESATQQAVRGAKTALFSRNGNKSSKGSTRKGQKR